MKTAMAEQHFQAHINQVFDAYAQPDNYMRMADLTRVAPIEALSGEDDGTVAVLQVRFKFIAPLSSAVTAVIDPDKITWVQTHTIDRASATERIAFRPDHYEKMLDFKGGHARYEEVSPDRTRRTLQGSFGIKGIPFFVRGAVEGAIASGLEEYYAEEAGQFQGFIAGG